MRDAFSVGEKAEGEKKHQKGRMKQKDQKLQSITKDAAAAREKRQEKKSGRELICARRKNLDNFRERTDD